MATRWHALSFAIVAWPDACAGISCSAFAGSLLGGHFANQRLAILTDGSGWGKILFSISFVGIRARVRYVEQFHGSILDCFVVVGHGFCRSRGRISAPFDVWSSPVVRAPSGNITRQMPVQVRLGVLWLAPGAFEDVGLRLVPACELRLVPARVLEAAGKTRADPRGRRTCESLSLAQADGGALVR